MTRLQLRDEPPDRVPAEVVAAFFYTDIRPLTGPSALLDWRLDGLLTTQLREGVVRGAPGEHLLVAGNHKVAASWVLFAGGGSHDELTPLTLSGLVDAVFDAVCQAGFNRLALALDEIEGLAVQDAEHVLWDLLDKERLRGLQVAWTWRGPQG